MKGLSGFVEHMRANPEVSAMVVVFISRDDLDGSIHTMRESFLHPTAHPEVRVFCDVACEFVDGALDDIPGEWEDEEFGPIH